jgi:HK97 family phage major capsid protein
MSLADKVRETRKAKKAELDTVLAAETPDEVRADALITEIKALDTRAADLDAIEAREAATAADDLATGSVGVTERAADKPSYDTVGRVVREERTYTAEKDRRGEVSYFTDAFLAQTGNQRATERLARHQREVEVEGELSTRATNTASFAGAVVPQYLVDLAALALRNGRPTANVCQKLPLPDQGMSIIIPRGTTAAAVACEATENSAVQNTDEVWANLTVPVVTIAGQQDVSRQALERGIPGIDGLIYMDLAGAYAQELDRQVLHGTGASNQMLGITATAGINAATAFGAAVSATNFTLKVAGGVQAIAGSGTAVQPRYVVMHPRRWGWLQSLVDTAGRPLAVAQPVGPFNAGAFIGAPGAYSGDGNPTGNAAPQIVGLLANGLPVITDANVTTTAGTINEDLVIVFDNAQALLWEDGDGAPRQLRFEQTTGGSLTTKLVVYGYAGFTAGRYPTAFSKIGGLDTTTNGLIAPSF